MLRSSHKKSVEPLALTIAEACQATGLGRTTLYHLIMEGKIKAKKQGKKVLILVDDLKDYLDRLPTWNGYADRKSKEAERGKTNS